MKKMAVFTLFLAVFCLAFEARSETPKAKSRFLAFEAYGETPKAKPRFSYNAEFIGAYGGIGTNFHTKAANINIGFKVRFLKYFPFGLEFINLIPNGTEIAFPLYLVNHPKFKLHLVLPFLGYQIPWRKTPMSVDWLKRKGNGVDFVMGIGAEYQIKTKGALAEFGFSFVSVGIDWRMFAPNPLWVFPNWGDLGKAIYKQAAEEGQIWLGVTFWR